VLVVMKFGGSSLANLERMEKMSRLVTAVTDEPTVVVLSAMGDTTDHLLRAARLAEAGQRDAAAGVVQSLIDAHLGVVEEPESSASIRRLGSELSDVIHGISLLQEQTPRTRALIASFGERFSVTVAAEIISRVRPAVAVDARTLIQTVGPYEGGRVRLEQSAAALEEGVLPIVDKGVIPVITGFIASTSEGITSTLGRGGSDYTASLVGEALNAREIWIWTDVEGILTADPRLVSEARTLECVSYREAAEMSYFGAKVIHPKTMLPAMRKHIPIRIRSTLNPESSGTVIRRESPRLPQGVKTVTSVSSTAIITVDGRGMSGIPGIAGRIFTTAQSEGVNVMMISQASSEQTVSLVVDGDDAARLTASLNEVFALEIGAGVIEKVACRTSVAVISIIGQGMSGTPGISGKLFQALGNVGINVLAIAQGASELSISVAVEESEVVRAVRATHTAFGLTRIVHVVLVGCGRVGRSLLGMLVDTNESLGRDLDIELKLTAVATRSKLLLSQQGLDPARVSALLESEAEARPGDQALVDLLLEKRFSDVLLVDVTASPLVALHEAALRAGFHVVTANKVPLSMELASYKRLVAARAASGATYGYETTFGAGLPVLHTLKELIHTGDSVYSVMGCFSGTLGFLCSRLEDGASLTESVQEAGELGYTEPDPREDLSGRDVARKALIIGRALGMELEPEQVQLEALVPGLETGLDAALEAFEAPLQARLREASEAGQALRYVAEISTEQVRVSLQNVPARSPIGSLRGPDNILVFRTRRYDDYPLVVRGPGAGADVTAAGVLGDMLKAARGRG
jgi:bifunctional aspartokinase / homoserine dehydrogenase 1